MDIKEKLNKNASKRLEVMQTLDGLGAGFSLASYDLDIRGAGNLLGDAQSGHIKDVGVELYQQMLADAIEDLKNKKIDSDEKNDILNDEFAPKINLGTSIYIPDDYIYDEKSRISFYQRISKCIDEMEAENIKLEMIDRFGELPEVVNNLFDIVFLKQYCYKLNIDKIEAGPKAILFGFRNDMFASPKLLIDFVNDNHLFMKIRPDQKLILKHADNNNTRRIAKIKTTLEQLSNLNQADQTLNLN